MPAIAITDKLFTLPITTATPVHNPIWDVSTGTSLECKTAVASSETAISKAIVSGQPNEGAACDHKERADPSNSMGIAMDVSVVALRKPGMSARRGSQRPISLAETGKIAAHNAIVNMPGVGTDMDISAASVSETAITGLINGHDRDT